MAVHLHVHTSGSVLDGAIKIDELVKKVKEQGEKAVAITDHGAMIKCYEFYKECIANNIKPIIGCEFYCGEEDDGNAYHLVLLAKNNQGLKNLYKLVHSSYELFYKKPRISMKMLDKYSEGLICLTACLGGAVARNYKENIGESIKYLSYLKGKFNNDLYLEIQPNSSKDQIEYNNWIQEASNNFNIEPVVTCDAHFLEKEDFESHDTLLCMQTKKKKNDTKRWRFPTKDTYIQTDEEIRSKLSYLSKDFVNRCINNTRIISDKCNITIEYEDLMPDLPGVTDPNHRLAILCNEGFAKRAKQGAFNGLDINEVISRVKYELSVLSEKGYSGYFLILEDFYRYCKENDIPVGVGRGSCCGCEVAYLLGLTEVEPIKYGLYFERFLNPSRNSPPDFDADICYDKRHLVIQYIKDKYGENNTAHIMAEGTLTTKAVFRKVLSVYGYEMKVINAYAKLISDKANNLKEAIELSEELKNIFNNTQEFKDMLRLEGLMSHASKHAAGILIMNDRVDDHFPVRFDKEENVMVCEWHKKIVEGLGAFKFDLLGLKQLTIFDKTLKAIERNHGVKITLEQLYNINYEDPCIYEILNKGKLCSIFQFTGDSASAVISKMKPTCFEDIMVAESICRPGVKEAEMYLDNKTNGFEKPIYWEHVKDILEPTFGAIVYQEQTMLIMNRIAGWSLGKADGMRKVKNLEEHRDDFVNSAVDNGYSSDVANSIFDRFDMAYSFNKSHACAYGKISAICCYLLAKYPTEFLASSMTLELTQAEPNIEGFIKEAKSLGINILPADINLSTSEFEPYIDGIRIPLTSIKNIGDSAYVSILENREKGEYKSLMDFVSRVPKGKVKVNSVTSLIKAGAFDLFNRNRSELLIEFLKFRERDYSKVFFYCDEVQIMYETEVYGFSLGKHPLDGYTNKDIKDFNNNDVINIIGIVKKITRKIDKNGNEMAFLDMENKECAYRGVAFARTYSKYKGILLEGMKLSLNGKKDGNSILINICERI